MPAGKEGTSMDFSQAGACGDYCGKCPNYPEECPGCSLETHPDCPFLVCCQSHEIEHCGLCYDFPCLKLARFVPDDRPDLPPGYHIANLRLRARVGTKGWLWEQGAMGA
jgi:hypothetical protein